jgi:hypothetical protein
MLIFIFFLFFGILSERKMTSSEYHEISFFGFLGFRKAARAPQCHNIPGL